MKKLPKETRLKIIRKAFKKIDSEQEDFLCPAIINTIWEESIDMDYLRHRYNISDYRYIRKLIPEFSIRTAQKKFGANKNRLLWWNYSSRVSRKRYLLYMWLKIKNAKN